MKYPKLAVFAAACIIASCHPVAAGTSDDCLVDADIGRILMEARQAGTSVIKTMKFIKDSNNESFIKLATTIANVAYTRPRFMTEKYRAAAVVDFSTDIYNNCMKVK